MSCEDSLSQSILGPDEVLTQTSQSSILLLDEVESLQNEILKDIDKQCEFSSFKLKFNSVVLIFFF